MPLALARQPLSVQAASFFTVALLNLLVPIHGLIRGLLAVCLGYLLANAMARVGVNRMRLGATGNTVVVVAVLSLGLFALLLNARGMVFGAVVQCEAMLHHLEGTVSRDTAEAARKFGCSPSW